MEVGHIVFRCGTALDKVKVRVLIDNNQRMLELACARRIQTEIRSGISTETPFGT